MSSSSRRIDRIGVTFDEPTLVADAGLIVPATLMVRLGLESLVNQMVRLAGRVGGALSGPQGAHRGGRDPGRRPPTSTTPIVCGPERPGGCCPSG